ncbi:MAG TPA: iron ABC transporter permease [Actinobacteria bacterium]|nr:iron ABC transporter permease [Actinomycetota bacterium]
MRAGSKGPDPRRRRRGDAVTPLAVAVAVLYAFPILYLAWRTLTLGGDVLAILSSPRTLVPLANSLRVAAATAVACAVVGTGLAWLVVRTDLPGRRWWRILLPLPLVVPSFVGATALLAAFGRGGLLPFVPRIEGFWGAFGVLTALSYPYVYVPVAARLSSTAPSLEEAARLLGRRPTGVVLRVVLPQVRGAIAAGTMLVFLYGLSDFGAVSLMRYDTITRAIFSARLFDPATSLTLGLLLALLALIVAGAERLVSPRRRPPARVGTGQVRYRLGRLAVPATGAVVGVVAVALAAPIAVFVAWVLRGSATVGAGFGGLGDGLGFLLRPTANSAIAAVVAGATATLVTLPVAYAAARGGGWAANAAAALVTHVFALPGLVVALAVVFWAIRAPGPLGYLYQTFPLLVLGYVLHFGAQAMRTTQAALAEVSRRYDEAGRTLGAGARRRFVAIELPLVVPGLLAGGGLVLLSTLKELPATLLLAPTGFETLATRIWGAAEDGFYAEVGITSLVLVGLSALLTWFLVLRHELRR